MHGRLINNSIVLWKTSAWLHMLRDMTGYITCSSL